MNQKPQGACCCEGMPEGRPVNVPCLNCGLPVCHQSTGAKVVDEWDRFANDVLKENPLEWEKGLKEAYYKGFNDFSWIDAKYEDVKDFISHLLSSERERILMDIAYAFGKYWPIGGSDLDDLPKLAEELVMNLQEIAREKERERCAGVVEGLAEGHEYSVSKALTDAADKIRKTPL